MLNKMLNKIKNYGIIGLIERAIKKIISIISFYNKKPEEVFIKEFFKSPTIESEHHALVTLRFIALESYLKNDFTGINLYIKACNGVQCINSDQAILNYKTLINSIKTHGYDTNSIIYVDSKNRVYNGNHRLACCIYFGINKIKMIKGRLPLSFISGQKRISTYNLNKEEINIFNKTYSRIYEKVNKL